MKEVSNDYIKNSEDIITTYGPSYSNKIDKEPPIINIKQKTYTIKAGDDISFLKDVTASDIIDGNVTNKINSNINEIDFSKEGIKKIEYTVSDSSGNVATEYVYVTVKEDNTDLIRFGQVGIILILIIACIFLTRYLRSIKLERRFSKYTINSSKNKSISLFDNIYLSYIDFINKLSKTLSKSKFISDRSKRYEKYTTAFDIKDTFIIMSRKIILGFIFVVVIIIIELLQSKLATSIEMLISFIIGFYTLDVVYIFKYSRHRKKIENDMLDAITIMNNAFKSGMSITQAVKLVSDEIKGPISKEFKKISLDISMGLDVEVAFKRFSNRVKSSEAMYLTASLSVLNKTGGNIIKVFNSIEKNMFSRRKLENELKSLTSSSKLIMYVLILVPPLFIVFINLINKEYFEPLFNTGLGVVLLVVMLIIYISYIFVVKRVLKVRGIKWVIKEKYIELKI